MLFVCCQRPWSNHHHKHTEYWTPNSPQILPGFLQLLLFLWEHDSSVHFDPAPHGPLAVSNGKMDKQEKKWKSFVIQHQLAVNIQPVSESREPADRPEGPSCAGLKVNFVLRFWTLLEFTDGDIDKPQNWRIDSLPRNIPDGDMNGWFLRPS